MPPGPYFYTDPITLTLAADHTSPTQSEGPDIVWQLNLDPDLPPSLHTTLGLQAQSFRILPTIARNKHPYQKLNDYLTSPRIDSLSVSYAHLSLAADADTQVTFEFWAREPYAVSGRVTLRNTGSANADLSARVAGLLLPLSGDQGMTVTKLDYKTYLRGQSGEITAALLMEGAPKPIFSPNQALEISQLLMPGEEFSAIWRCSLAFSPIQSQERAQKPFPVNWQAEVARHEVAELSREIEIETPHHDWNILFKSMQDQANQLLKQTENSVNSEPGLGLTFFEKRNIHTPVGKTYSTLQRDPSSGNRSVLALRQLARALLPAQTELAVNLVKTSLAELDSQYKNAPPFPRLAALVWDVHTYYQHPPFLAECLPLLVEQTLRWFSPKHDRDQDGLPEWFSPEQAELTDLKVFDLLDESALPTRISSVESRALAALLADELEIIQRMTRALGDADTSSRVLPFQERLAAALARFRAQHPDSSFIDRDNNLDQAAQRVAEVQLPITEWQSVQLETPARLNIRLEPTKRFALPAAFKVLGADSAGNPLSELVEPGDIVWLPTHFHATTQSIFSRFDQLENLSFSEGLARIYTSDLNISDISRLVDWERSVADSAEPVWAAPNDPRYRFGLPTDLNPQAASGGRVNTAWNCLVIEHLNQIGEKKLAWELLSRLILGFTVLLKREHALMDGFTSDHGIGWGNRNSARGILPPLLLLEVAGIQIINEHKVYISGENPFPWPIVARLRGLEVRREGKNTVIQFPDGSVEHHFGSSGKWFTSKKSPAEAQSGG